MDLMNEILREIGGVVEKSGKTMQGEETLTRQELTELRDTLNSAAVIIQTIRDTRPQ